jgi:hypothetical protein
LISAARAALFAAAAAYAAPASAAPSFEEVARQAEPVSDLGMLLSPFVDDCRHSRGELEQLRCESVRNALRARLPGRTFLYTRDGAEAVPATPYDPRARGLRLTVVGCLSCKQPVEASGERRYLTLKVPSRGPSGGPVAAEVSRATVSLASPAEAEKWARTVQPFLRVELLFHPADQPWTVGTSRGYAFVPVGVRVYNRCTGEVLVSDPPSQGPAPRESQCTPAPDEEQAEQPAAETLSPAAINEAMAQVKGELDGCLARSRLRGTSRLAFEVAPTGLPERVTIEGAAAGTPVGECLAGVGMKVVFPAFHGEKQRFKYPVSSRR